MLQVEFGSKEEYMKIMNTFITSNMQTMASFVDNLSSPPPSSKPPPPSPSRDISVEHLDLLYTQVSFLKEKIFRKWGVVLPGDNTEGKPPSNPYGELKATKVERALELYPHAKKKKVVVGDTVQHEVALKAVHKELKQRVESAEKRARAQQTQAHARPASPATTQGSARAASPAPLRPSSPAPGASASAQDDEVAKLIDEVVRLRASLDAERSRSRELEERVIEEEKKIEKEAEARFHKEYKVRVQQVKDTLDLLKTYKDQLLARPELAAEFKSLRLAPG